MRSRKYARLHTIGRDRPSRSRANKRRRNTWIDGNTSAGAERPVDDHRRADDVADARGRHEVSPHARRRDVTRLHERPVCRIVVVFVDHVVGRQRRPADKAITTPPIDPGRAPLVTRHPEPLSAFGYPAAVVIGDPAPIGFVVVGNPVPAPIVGIDPVADRIRTPAARSVIRHPDVAPAWILTPLAIRFERIAEFVRHLGVSRRHRPGHD